MIWNLRVAVTASMLLTLSGVGLAGAEPAATPKAPSPAAPAQTTDSAQEFLKGTLARGDSTLLIVDPADIRAYGSGGAVITSLYASTYFYGSRKGYMACHTEIWTNRKAVSDSPCADFNRKIDWAKVKSAGRISPSQIPNAQGLNLVAITGLFSGTSYGTNACYGPFDMMVIAVASEEIATRVGRAMNFLKENCDPAAGSGF